MTLKRIPILNQVYPKMKISTNSNALGLMQLETCISPKSAVCKTSIFERATILLV